MLDEKRIKEAQSNVKSYLAEGLMTKHSFDNKVFEVLSKNAHESLETANFLFKNNIIGKIIVCTFLVMFMITNIQLTEKYLKTGIGITLGAEKWAIDWIYKDAKNSEFNIDAYVPPQIYFSYLYLFRWYGNEKYGREPQMKLVKTLYTLYEPDNEHPQFLEAWMQRQDGIGRIVKEDFFGDITVQKRERIKYE